VFQSSVLQISTLQKKKIKRSTDHIQHASGQHTVRRTTGVEPNRTVSMFIAMPYSRIRFII
ncbi:hypothetical protein, partial [Bifidobacterium mongoliense]|uniref:hypothetical protein n=1 Tax=Bifidobacterium mongoliense TaxID=518643 RepID=UPI002648B1E2